MEPRFKKENFMKRLEVFIVLFARILIATIFSTALIIIPIWDMTFGELGESPENLKYFGIILGCTVLVSTIAVLQFHITKKQEDDNRKKVIIRWENIEKEEQKIANSSPNEDISLTKLWALNNQRISSYHTAAVDQSVRSFRSTQIATYAGLLVVLLSAGFAAFAHSTIATISAGAVGIIGGGLSAYISSTFMKSQAAAAEQLRRFFNHPVELSRMLSAERLLKDLNDDDRSEATKLIIKAMLEGHLNETTNRGSASN